MLPSQLIRSCVLTLLCTQAAFAFPGDGKEIADRFGEDLSFASKQVIRGFTAIFAPILDTAHSIPKVLSKVGGRSDSAESTQSFQNVLIRDGLNAIGKGVKATATILSSPARVAGAGLDEFRKVGQAGVDARLGTDAPEADKPMDDRTKIVSTLLNTTSAEFSQANLGAVLVEVAVKNRIKDIANRTASSIVPKKLEALEKTNVEKRESPSEETEKEVVSTTTSRVDVLLDRFKEAVKRNDDKLQEALKELLKRINPPKE